MRDVPGLTGMRGLAAVYVGLYHLSVRGVWILPTSLATLQGAGWSGVDFFFVLSGYLLASIYDQVSLRYFVRRVFRTFPLYYLCLPVYALAGLLVLSPLDLVYAENYFASTFSNSPLWTLMLEELFYFVLFPLMLLIGKRRAVWLIAPAAALSLVWRAPWPSSGYDFVFKQMPSYFYDYVLGVALAGLPAQKGRKRLLFTGALWGAAMFVMGGSVNGALSPLISGTAYAGLVATWQTSRVFTNRVSMALGRASYGIYLFQYPAIVLLGPVPGFILAVGLALLSWRYFESKLVAMGRCLTAESSYF
jgi:peptidoglycan/LPS O-acetylase OafA/YrhL